MMDIDKIFNTIIKTGLCCYGFKTFRVFICISDFFPGTGDYEDDVKVCNDKEQKSYCIWFEDCINKGMICAGGGYFNTLNEAVYKAENSSGFEKWID